MYNKEIDLNKITTEGRNLNTIDIDELSTIEMLKKMNEEDITVPHAVTGCLDQIAPFIDQLCERFKQGGRLIYMGAGTSGRIGLMDAVECHPTFSCSFDMVQCLMAGGEGAMIQAVEGAEDNVQMAIDQLNSININKNDTVVGIAASGRTPYTVSGVKYARSLGCLTACITTSNNSILEQTAEYPIVAVTGAEVLMGSTRLKSGTAQKLICNMITTISMIKIGRSYSNLLTDMMPTNGKLVERSKNILHLALGIDFDEAEALLNKYGNIKQALFGALSGIEDVDLIKKYLDHNFGSVKQALAEYNNNK